MKMQRKEDEVLDLALIAAQQHANLLIEVVAREEPYPINGADHGVDAVLKIRGALYQAEIKRWAQHAPIAGLIRQTQRLDNGILIADYINPNIADKLREAEVQFLDTAGNAYINQPDCYIQIKGNRPPQEHIAGPRKIARAFTTAGLKVTYALLKQPDLADQPYRRIAEQTGVTLGTVGKAMDDLRTQGYLIQQKKERKLIRKTELFQAWIERYPANLREKIKLGTFQAPEADWWKHTNLENLEGYWGGEIAAAHYTAYLKPQIATVYLAKKALTPLIAKARLRKANRPVDVNAVHIYEIFWPFKVKDNENPYVDQLLTYADLMATHDARNIETARRLYDDGIARHLGEA